jgi:DNA invertase Pin-like site-specific DNA recombinase
VYKGRKAVIDPAKIKAMKAEGMGASAIAKALNISRASVYRVL